MESEKISFQQLQYYFLNNRTYFIELSTYWKQRDINYYNQFIAPFFKNGSIPIECPFCKQINHPVNIKSIKTIGWLIFFFLEFIALCFFVLGVKYWSVAIVVGAIGIIGLTIKNNFRICTICRTRIN